MESKSIKLYIQIFLLIVVMAGLVAGCSSNNSNKIGELVGVEVSGSLNPWLEDETLDGTPTGIVYVELDDGTKVRAIWDSSLGDELTGGMKLEITPTDDPDLWKVVRIVETP